jgi:hypothetical protein
MWCFDFQHACLSHMKSYDEETLAHNIEREMI